MNTLIRRKSEQWLGLDRQEDRYVQYDTHSREKKKQYARNNREHQAVINASGLKIVLLLRHARRSLSTFGGTHSGQSTPPPLLSSSHSPSSPRGTV